MSNVRLVLAAGLLATGVLTAPPTASAQSTSAQPTPAQGTPDLPKRRPEEAQADPMQAFDVNKNGKLELAEVKSAAAARFDELNPDQDDSLDPQEAAPVLQGQAFRDASTDGSGKVNKAQYLAYVERMFNAANPDKDGALERAELESPAGQALMRLLR